MGRANEQIAGIQENYSAQATSYWLESLERNLAMMKEYQVSHTESSTWPIAAVPLLFFLSSHPS